MKLKTQVMDNIMISKALTRISYEIIERSENLDNVILVGVKTRGIPLSKIIAENIAKFSGVSIPTYELDATLYRDDIDNKEVIKSSLAFDVTNKDVIIIDDVLFTGRTTRACMDAILDNGRAKSIRLCVLMDRGHRELPIRADFVGKNVPTSLREKVVVKIAPFDSESSVAIYE